MQSNNMISPHRPTDSIAGIDGKFDCQLSSFKFKIKLLTTSKLFIVTVENVYTPPVFDGPVGDDPDRILHRCLVPRKPG